MHNLRQASVGCSDVVLLLPVPIQVSGGLHPVSTSTCKARFYHPKVHVDVVSTVQPINPLTRGCSYNTSEAQTQVLPRNPLTCTLVVSQSEVLRLSDLVRLYAASPEGSLGSGIS